MSDYQTQKILLEELRNYETELIRTALDHSEVAARFVCNYTKHLSLIDMCEMFPALNLTPTPDLHR